MTAEEEAISPREYCSPRKYWKVPPEVKDFWELWCAVYDGPLDWEGRSAFEQIEYLEKKLADATR